MNRAQWAAQLAYEMAWAPGVTDGIVAQATGENTGAQCNPLADTEDWPGATPFNAAGVKNYPSADAGLAATCHTLSNGLYAPVLAAGVAGDADAYVAAIAASPWGTWHGDPGAAAATLAAVRSDPSYGQVEVPGTVPLPPGVDAMAGVGVIGPHESNDGHTHVYVERSDGHLIEYVSDGLNGRPWNAYDLTADAGTIP